MLRRTRSTASSCATCGSVTSIARRTPRRRSSQPASADAPGPNFTGVASSVKTVSCAMATSPLRRAGILGRMDLRARLAEVVGDRHAFDDPDLSASYERDWTGRFGGRATVVVRPADTAETAEVVRR